MNILCYAETRGDEPRKVAFELLAAARSLVGSSGGEVHALAAVASSPAPSAVAIQDRLAQGGADRTLLAVHPGFSTHNVEALVPLLAEVAARGGYGAVLIPASAHGRDIAPRLAARLNSGLGADVTEIAVDGDAFLVRHPVNTAKVIATVRVTGKPPVITVRPGAFAPVDAPRAAVVDSVTPPVDPGASKLRVEPMAGAGSAKLDLSEAPVIVAGGRGLKGAEHFALVEELAAAFGNAAVGCTRAVSDAGWRSHSDQIGQTGRTVTPDLYLAIGISGAIQHIAGMRNSRTIVAVNRDREAPIFKIADYGIVGDAFEVVPLLTEAVRRARAG